MALMLGGPRSQGALVPMPRGTTCESCGAWVSLRGVGVKLLRMDVSRETMRGSKALGLAAHEGTLTWRAASTHLLETFSPWAGRRASRGKPRVRGHPPGSSRELPVIATVLSAWEASRRQDASLVGSCSCRNHENGAGDSLDSRHPAYSHLDPCPHSGG